jgi:predicted aspartyl protease
MTPTAQIEVIGARQSVELTAIIDTGFSGDVCVPARIAVQLGIELFSEQLVEFADGSQRTSSCLPAQSGFLARHARWKSCLRPAKIL